jgi:Hypervirulence associated proteins TUDOR domain
LIQTSCPKSIEARICHGRGALVPAKEIEMSDNLKQGDKVSWESSGGHSTGKVVKKLTSPMTIKGHKVAASKDNPEYLVETDNGKQAAHKPDALKKD